MSDDFYLKLKKAGFSKWNSSSYGRLLERGIFFETEIETQYVALCTFEQSCIFILID